MKTILTIASYYLPGYRAGGPIRSVANLISWLGDEFRFLVLTRDRDLQDTQPYGTIEPGTWQTVGKASVMYLSPRQIGLRHWYELLKSIDYDVLFLNSFFGTLSVQTLFLRRLGLSKEQPLLLAPRGEFSPGALALKPKKKWAYVQLARITGLWQDAVWLATSDLEAQDIRLVIKESGDQLDIHIAPNLVVPATTGMRPMVQIPKESGKARIVFVSRISRTKNLDYALELLPGLEGDVVFDLYGPAEDMAYFHECQTQAERLPGNIRFTYHGPVTAERVHDIFSSAHVFLLPTLGENFGHVIHEALRAGCPVLISNRTPWHNLEQAHAGFAVPLEQPARFRKVLQFFVDMDASTHRLWRAGAHAYAAELSSSTEALEQNRRLFATMAALAEKRTARAITP